jgi:hypothetical protein
LGALGIKGILSWLAGRCLIWVLFLGEPGRAAECPLLLCMLYAQICVSYMYIFTCIALSPSTSFADFALFVLIQAACR